MMRRICCAAVMAMSGLGLSLALAGTDVTRAKTSKEIMQILNKGQKSESAKLKAALAAKTPDWDAVQSSTKQYAELGLALGENDPPKGSKESWKTQTETFASQTKALADAADKKNLTATKAAFQKISMSCMGCHRAHRLI